MPSELLEPAGGGNRVTFQIIDAPRAPVVRMPWWVTAIKVSIAGALLVWAFFG